MRQCFSIGGRFCQAQLSFVERRDLLIIEIHFVLREPIWNVRVRNDTGDDAVAHVLRNKRSDSFDRRL
jgi:hypothetical protein